MSNSNTTMMKTEISRAKDFTLPADPMKAMQEMMNTIDDIKSIYLKENEILNASDTKSFVALQEDKIAAARRYQRGAEQLIERREEFSGVESTVREKLEAMQKEFSVIAGQNLKSVDTLRRSAKRLNDRIMTLARETARKDSAHYSAHGALKTNDRLISMGINESA